MLFTFDASHLKYKRVTFLKVNSFNTPSETIFLYNQRLLGYLILIDWRPLL